MGIVSFIGCQVAIAAFYIFTLACILHFVMSCRPGWARVAWTVVGVMAAGTHALIGCMLILDFWSYQ